MNKLLIIEDEPVARKMLGRTLAKEGYEVFTAANGVEGLELFRLHQPQIIILDLNMPQMDGIEFLMRLNPQVMNPYSVIVLTGQRNPSNIKKCYELGVHSFLRKPVDYYELIGQVKHTFALQHFSLELKQEIEAKETAYQQLEVQHKILKATFEGMAEGALTLDRNLHIKMISEKACRIINIAESQALNKPAVEILGDVLAGPKSELKYCVKNKQERSGIQSQLLCQSGAMVPVSLSVIPLQTVSVDTDWLLLFKDIREEERMLRERGRGFSFGPMISCNPRMMEIFNLIENVAPSDASVFVQGESGTGKELVAREIHARSNRAQGPFHAVNCAAIAPHLLESEFFGHEKGAFTDAHRAKQGRFELADRGTLFLDEINEIPLELQGKLLRALEEKNFERVGGTKNIHVDMRVIAATNKNIQKMVEDGDFRKDLYYRLHVVPIYLPPLRDRRNDIPLLVSAFIEKFNKRDNRQVKDITSDSFQSLLEHAWPGNIRELFHAIEYAFATSKGTLLHAHHLPDSLQRLSFSKESPLATAENERERILAALRQTNYRKGEAAALLGINPSTLYRKRQKLGI